jgi:uncharacterized protein YjbJ (UPF0337 family)
MDENRAEGTVRKYGGRVEEGVGSITGDAKTRAIETQPYTTAAVAFGIGWLLGRMRRPL